MLLHRSPVRTGRRVQTGIFAAVALISLLVAACGDDDDGTPTNTGQACKAVDQCYPGVKEGELLGEAVCLTDVEGGYCSHLCTQDSDCCAAEGECTGNHAEVCSPFESNDDKYCFPELRGRGPGSGQAH
jgi:hypothetical protein